MCSAEAPISPPRTAASSPQLRRLEEDLADLKARYAYAQQLIYELRARVPEKNELRVGVPGFSGPLGSAMNGDE